MQSLEIRMNTGFAGCPLLGICSGSCLGSFCYM
nr:MAG TPA_asm: Glutamine amidotransferase class-I [Caudoviricetes sp.]